jgi:hypothetical protein
MRLKNRAAKGVSNALSQFTPNGFFPQGAQKRQIPLDVR